MALLYAILIPYLGWRAWAALRRRTALREGI